MSSTFARRRKSTTRRAARLLLAAGGLLALPLLSAGCHDYNAPIEARGERYAQPWLTMGSEELRNDTVVGQATRNRDEAGILFVTVPVRNTTDKQLYFDGTMVFYDHAGMEINRVPRTVTIPARQSETFAGNSTSPRAESFHLSLSYPRVE